MSHRTSKLLTRGRGLRGRAGNQGTRLEVDPNGFADVETVESLLHQMMES